MVGLVTFSEPQRTLPHPCVGSVCRSRADVGQETRAGREEPCAPRSRLGPVTHYRVKTPEGERQEERNAASPQLPASATILSILPRLSESKRSQALMQRLRVPVSTGVRECACNAASARGARQRLEM